MSVTRSAAFSPAVADAQPASSAWRQYTFFDSVPVRDIHEPESSPDLFKKTPEISCITESSFGTIIADIHGSIFLLNRDFDLSKSWIAHSGGRVTHMVERKGILITLGEEDTVRHPFLKVWDLGNVDVKTGAPILLRSAKVQSGNRPHPVTTIALSVSLSYLVIALGDGTVLLYRHLDQSIFSGSNNLSALPKPRVVHESPSEPVTGLGFREPEDENPNIYLYIVTTNHVLSYQASGRGSGGAPTTVDEVGSALGCATLDWKARDMVVAKEEAVYICGVEGRGACYVYEGIKASVHTHLNYLVIVSPPFAPSASAASATVRNFVARTVDAASTDVTKVTVLDLENKFVAYSNTFTGGVRDVFSASGEIYLLSNDCELICLEEKPTPIKLNILYQRSQYQLALNLAKTQKLDESSVADIHRQYGDFLYSKADYDGAMQQLIKTIGHVQPSYVIRKFLDAQRIHNLVTYLQELHALGLANSDHTTLLLNTYTKLKDVTRLDNFIKTESKRSAVDGDGGELPFDLETAIRVCRQAGYFEHASYLAKKYERHEDYLQIQIEDAGNYRDALTYLRRLGTEASENNLARYGRAMLHSLPEETTQLLIDVCTSLTPLSIETETPTHPSRQPSAVPYLSLLALNRVPTPTVASDNPPPSAVTVRQGERGSRRDSLYEDTRTITPPPQTPSALNPVQQATAQSSAVKRPSPRLFFPHFIDHKDRFMQFLETVALKRWGQSLDDPGAELTVEHDPFSDPEAENRDQVAVWNTLLELYLPPPPSSLQPSIVPHVEAGSSSEKALRLLESAGIPYDLTHALILCSTRAFTPGLVLLWEKMGMYEDVIRFWMDKEKEDPLSGASVQVINCLKKYSSQAEGKDQERYRLYPLVLRFLTSTPELLTRHKDDVKRMLEVIDRELIMPTLGVVQVLSRNEVASVGLVKEWLLGRIKEAREEIDTASLHQTRKLIDSYRTETQTKLRQVQELSDPDHPRVFHVTQCSACKGQLDLPSVHFMCNHSYHQRCLGDHDTECPNCAMSHGMICEIRRNNERLADQHDVFVSEVKEGGFAAIATGFSRGIMNLARVEEVVV